MRLALSFAASALLVTLTAAAPQAQPAPKVTIYNKGEYKGEQVTFAAKGECKSIAPRIESISIPGKSDVWCQVFNNRECQGEGGRVIVDSVAQFSVEEVYPAVICNVFRD
ncbi:hypothetical protein ASPVEDRAFT_88779 [Aspergillus versicolor CBS 583.65]|uniref:Beta/gamma crystallin 'Greek key' domain-containing protein n=1 Tax=Aspergillus versicolor CBS 583.65 TaxID=1036611 RepID=A0A1L9Q194_ASPVE|nr:uncharacterized protein ASPVEDRAFT_88779 [Aspergillus versicolor CBS 583.65]OJJ07531.1 hypothetical protein ASPVEDRAFT_88779 [Aspergillus versicolor CBS 583.65]